MAVNRISTLGSRNYCLLSSDYEQLLAESFFIILRKAHIIKLKVIEVIFYSQ